MDIIKNSKYFSSKNEKIICSHFFLQKNENKSIMLTSDFGATFFRKVNPLFKIGHFFCPFFKTQNTFVQKAMPFCDLTETRITEIILLILLPYIVIK